MYKLTDDGASLLFEAGTKTKRVLKHRVQGVEVIAADLVKIDVGHCLRNLYVRKSQVSQPAVATAEDLCEAINEMITNCVCCDCGKTVNPN
jgi:hypothetical protein